MENTVKFVEISEDNYYDILKLEIDKSQEAFVAPNVRSLADSYLYRYAGDVFPYGIEYQGKTVGFILTDLDFDESVFMIWRMMIGVEYQGKGYGKMTIESVLEKAKAEGFKKVVANYVVGNDSMKKILGDYNFVEDGLDEVYNEVKNYIEV